MASNAELQEKYRLYKFTKILTLKVAQIVVQSRQGKKITRDYSAKHDNGVESPPLQWFNLSIPDEPAVNEDTKKVLNGEVIETLKKIVCIEILLRTSDGDEMVLEVWSVKLTPGSEACSPSMVYYRMSLMLKSTLTISRMTPAYKLSRSQHKESYKISHKESYKMYSGDPNYNLLGEQRKTINVSELNTPIGTISIEVAYRTKMTILPKDQHKITYEAPPSSNDIMVKSDHFNNESPKRVSNEKKELDLSKPLTAGAFVDTIKIKELHDSLSQKLPPELAMSWLLTENEKMKNRMKTLAITEDVNTTEAGCSGASTSQVQVVSNAIEVPKSKNGDRYTGYMDFPFAGGSPIADLANFYHECLQARSISDEWTDVILDPVISTDSETLSKQLKMFEDAVPEFDSMVASMFSNSESGSDNS